MVQNDELDLAIIEKPIGMAEGGVLQVELLDWIGRPAGRANDQRFHFGTCSRGMCLSRAMFCYGTKSTDTPGAVTADFLSGAADKICFMTQDHTCVQ